MGDNVALRKHVDELGVTQPELARLVNAQIEVLTGRFGTVSERTIHNWFKGATKWPPAKIRIALGEVFGCSIRDLGFTPPSASCADSPEDAMKRREFIAAVGGATVGATTPAKSAPSRIGSSDIERLYAEFAKVVASDHRLGGRSSIETQALGMADSALTLQEAGSVSQRVRGGLYACAAAFTSSAMWAAIDGRRFDAAQSHHARASSLAAMSGDATISFRIWSHAGSMYRHMKRPADALAANDVARRLSITGRDPLFASLGHARHAAILGLTGDTGAVRQAIDRAQDALSRADIDINRPVWITAQYDQAELESLSLAAYLSLGDFERAESCAHRSLALLRPHMMRSRAITISRLAHAQLGQGDVEQAVKTAMLVPADQASHPRIRVMLSQFGQRLVVLADDSEQTRSWNQYVRDTWRPIS
ncbi:MAG: Tat pathway signal sequence domain protein [Catenulispora sp. 13_1_20CM_3_70_7]|nr:MAG: Tat pathway signal sequence domain protein [Catenulispora sp. 13_1_20CM_3_70_7]